MQEWNKQVYLYSTDIAKFGFIAKLVLAAELNQQLCLEAGRMQEDYSCVACQSFEF